MRHRNWAEQMNSWFAPMPLFYLHHHRHSKNIFYHVIMSKTSYMCTLHIWVIRVHSEPSPETALSSITDRGMDTIQYEALKFRLLCNTFWSCLQRLIFRNEWECLSPRCDNTIWRASRFSLSYQNDCDRWAVTEGAHMRAHKIRPVHPAF